MIAAVPLSALALVILVLLGGFRSHAERRSLDS